jgi:hypothetical protein
MTYLSVEDTFQYLDKLPNGNLIEFGVFSGNCLNRLIKGAENVGKPFEKIYGFDSFTGIPKETEGVLHNPEWPEGAFNVCKDFNLKTVSEALHFVRKNIERKDGITFIPGYFEHIEPKQWINLTNSASYIHIDVDLYRSTIEVLDFILPMQILKISGIIRYDDWMWCPEGEAGNSLAHQQMIQKYNVKFNRLSTNVFQLMSY